MRYEANDGNLWGMEKKTKMDEERSFEPNEISVDSRD